MKANNINKRIFFIFGLYLVILLGSMFLSPYFDDYEFADPIQKFTPEILLPQASFWRPIENIFRYLLSFSHGFPYVNHFFVVTGHFVSVTLFYNILHHFKIDTKIHFFATIVFCISAGVIPYVLSVDSLNQTWSMVFGLIALKLFLENKHRCINYTVFCFLSIFSKESGISWLIVIPLLSLLKDIRCGKEINKARILNCIKHCGFGCILILIYMILRISIGGNFTAQSEGEYAFKPFSFITIQNVVVLCATAFSAIDTISLMVPPKNLVLLILTIVFTLPFLCMLFYAFIKKIKDISVYLLIFIILILSGPQILIGGGAGEMHAYSTVLGAAFILAVLFTDVRINTKISRMVFALFLVSTVIVGIRKYESMYNCGKMADMVAENIISQTTVIPEKVLSVGINAKTTGYSIFSQNAAWASDYGKSALRKWGFKHPAKFVSIKKSGNEEQIENEIIKNSAYVSQYDAIWIIKRDGSVKVYEN